MEELDVDPNPPGLGRSGFRRRMPMPLVTSPNGVLIMLANPWIPTTPTPRRSHRKKVGELSSARLFGVVTSLFALVTTTAVMEPIQPVQAAVPVVEVALASTTVEIPATSLAPSSTTRPTLPDGDAPAAGEELLVLADRSVVGGPVVVPEADTTTTTVATQDTTVSTVGSVELALFALDVGDVGANAVASDEALVVQPIPTDPWECHERADEMPLVDDDGSWDRNLIAQMTYTVFECVMSVAGFADAAPTSYGWDAAGTWGFESLAEQAAAESVVVGYCESQAFAGFALTGNNPWGYGGVFQMGDREMRLYGFSGASKFDPVDNVYSAATYFVAMNRRGASWGGWGPWAVVNTNYNDEVNDRVKVPVLPRFTSTDPAYRGRRGAELPAWAVDPWSYVVPGFNGCPTTGGQWAPAQAIES